MDFEKLDTNTYIHYGVKGRMPNVSKNIKQITNNKVLSNNPEYSLMTFSNRYLNGISNQPSNYKQLINYIKATPELLAIVDAFVTDIMSDGHHFVGSDSDVKLAESFYTMNKLDQVLYKALVDTYVYGNGFLVKNFITKDEIKELIGNHGFETKEVNNIYYELKEYIDEISTKNMLIEYMPAATVSIYTKDKYGENIVYKQTVDSINGTQTAEFSSDEVIHFKDIDLDGKLYGFSRLYALKSEMQTLAYTKDYFGLYFLNNATPEKIFIAKNMVIGSKEYNAFVKQLQEFKKPQNKRSNLFVTSDLDIKDLNSSSETTNYLGIMQKFTNILAMTYTMPPSRYGATSKATAEEATLSNQGYYRNISYNQDKIERTLNSQIFKPIFNVDYRFNRNYREDEQREVMIKKTMVDITQQLLDNDLITKESVPKLLSNVLGLKNEEFITIETINDDEINDSRYMQRNFKDSDAEDQHIVDKKKNHTPKKYKK